MAGLEELVALLSGGRNLPERNPLPTPQYARPLPGAIAAIGPAGNPGAISMAGAGSVGGGIPMGPGGTSAAGGGIPNIPGLPRGFTPNPGANPGAIFDDLAAQAAGGAGTPNIPGGVGGVRGLWNSIPGQFPGKLNSTLGRGALGLGLGVGGNILGEAAGGDDSIIGRFIKGAGTGGGLGAMFGPKGAVVGGAIGGVGNALLGGEGEDPAQEAEQRLQQVLARSTFTDEDREYFTLLYEVQKATTNDPQAALQVVGQAIMQRLQDREEERSQHRNMLEMQAVTSEYFKPFTKSIIDSARQRAMITERLAEDVPENYRGLMRADAAASLDNATKVANAYATQAQLLPAFASMQQQQGLVDQAAQTLYSQGLNNAVAGNTGQLGGGGGLQALVAQALGQG